MTATYPPIKLDGKVLRDGFSNLLSSFASDLSAEFSIPTIPDKKIQSLTSTLIRYLTLFVNNKQRRSDAPLRPKESLEFHILRSRNPAEEYKNAEGKWIKDEKKWYRIVLSETFVTDGEADVQIIAEGEMRLNKAEVLVGFEEAVDGKVEKWSSEERESAKKYRSEMGVKASQRKKAKEMEEGEGKGKAKATETIMIDDDSDEEE